MLSRIQKNVTYFVVWRNVLFLNTQINYMNKLIASGLWIASAFITCAIAFGTINPFAWYAYGKLFFLYQVHLACADYYITKK